MKLEYPENCVRTWSFSGEKQNICFTTLSHYSEKCGYEKQPPEVFCKKKAPPATLLKKETLAQVFSCEFCEISKNNFSQNTSGRLLLGYVILYMGKNCAIDYEVSDIKKTQNHRSKNLFNWKYYDRSFSFLDHF